MVKDDNRNPFVFSFPAFSFKWFPMAKMYSKTATNFWLDSSCLLAWIFWFISWNTQIFLQFRLKMWANHWCLYLLFAKSLIVLTWSKSHFSWWIISYSTSWGSRPGVFRKDLLKVSLQDKAGVGTVACPWRRSHPFWLPNQPCQNDFNLIS